MINGFPGKRGRGSTRQSFSLWLCLLVLLLLAPMSARSQEAPAAQFQEQVEVHWVLVPVVVRSPRGYITDLKRSDFSLTVDGRTVSLASFDRGNDAPVSLVLMQDLSGSMGIGNELELSRRALDCLLAAHRPGDRWAVASFANGQVFVDVPFTSNLGAVREAIEGFRAYGKTALYDAVSWLPKIALSSESNKRAAILITDGVDNASTIDPGTARGQVEAARLPVYVLGFSTGTPYALDPEGHKIYRYADLLNLLASLTGGSYYPVSDQDQVDAACRSIVQSLRFQYVLGFKAGGRGVDRYHHIEVNVDRDRRHWKLSFRRGYQGPPPLASP
ncbi:MAG TPA: VWA domain-containing protein [Thermoanaerobaculia bacterium]|nr:VWA domain-containing protein [Thermoanaerobaculia bacterium]